LIKRYLFRSRKAAHCWTAFCFRNCRYTLGMNGVELQGKLIAQGHHLPIIFLTAFPEIKARAQALAAGAIGFLAKPFNDEMLITCLNEALGARSV
jgi:FixJ family two-component response regulator